MKLIAKNLLILCLFCMSACVTTGNQSDGFSLCGVNDSYQILLPNGMLKDSHSIDGFCDIWKHPYTGVNLVVDYYNQYNLQEECERQLHILCSNGKSRVYQKSDSLIYFQYNMGNGSEQYFSMIKREINSKSFYVVYYGKNATLKNAEKIAESIQLLPGFRDNKQDANGSKTYKCEAYKISYPSWWGLTKYASPEQQGDFYAGMLNENIGFSLARIDEVYISLDEVVRRSNSGLKESGYSVETKKTKVKKYPAYKTIIEGKGKMGEMKSWVYTFFAGDVVYVIRFGRDPELFDQYQDVFQSIINSLVIYEK